ncbi:RES family NAD+ phosphorylase [Dongshaea marina]|uniref:RES family NAD+ phosphorylase n=1 Tax=Dongshaea marina TaxID=2047966 RepID=UPI000D3EDED7|nr:RES domain-containing protein [Dongshaea marina]
MKGYRIVKSEYLSSAWSGYGAELYGGRWNSKGHKAVYCATSISLAMLEILVHINSEALLNDYVLLEIELTEDDVMGLHSSDLPTSWNAEPATEETQELGDEWLQSQLSVALLVPSVVVPQEMNLLLNPLHPEFTGIIQKAARLPVLFDRRLKGN